MTNVIRFPTAEEDNAEELDGMIEAIKEDLDTLFFIKLDKEGSITMGHSPASVRDLVFMYHQINRYINFLLEGGEED